MKHLTSLLAGAAFVMAAAGLALAVRNYLSEQEEWELYDGECISEDDLEGEDTFDCAPAQEEPAPEEPSED